MNFKDGGMIVKLLEDHNGTDSFWALSSFAICIMLVIFYYQGLLEMFVSSSTCNYF